MFFSALFYTKKFQQIFRYACVAVFFVLVAVVFLPHTVHAQTTTQNLSAVGVAGGFGTATLGQIIAKIIKIFLGILGVIVLGLVIYAGYLWMTAAGEEKKVQEAKDTLRNAVIGLAIVATSYATTSFIMDKLFGATKGMSAPPEIAAQNNPANDLLGGYSGAAALGKVIDSHDPGRDATGVPRNKIIQVVYKFPVDPETVIDASAPNAVFKVTKDEKGVDVKRLVSGPVKGETFLLYPTTEGKKAALKNTDIWVTIGSEGNDSTVIVYDPIPFLGSAAANTPYTAELSTGINRLSPKGTSIFSGFSGGYSWKFTVSTELDLVPPTIVSVVPAAGGTYDRNITVQVTFSEPVNLASAVGQYDGKSKQFKNIRVAHPDGSFVAGVWHPGGGFNIIDFTTTDACGTNACGQKMFCLPAKEKLEVRALSGVLDQPGVNAQVKAQLALQGITDTAGNALDGGGENAKTSWSKNAGKPQGSPQDDFFYSFSTTDATKISDPRVVSVEPLIGASGKDKNPVTLTSPVTVTFDSLMKASSFGDVALVAKNPKAQAGFWKNFEEVFAPATATSTKLIFQHVPFAKSQAYAPMIPSSVQDTYQNCFLASGKNADIGLQCIYQQPGNENGEYTCCNGSSSNEKCNLLDYGKAQ
jgi:TRAP-type C4-dicarboxylate transport system permease small subunit